MNDGIMMQITMYCEGVRVGTKPVAMMSIQARYIQEVTDIVKNEGLKLYIQDVEDVDSWKTLFIYKHGHLLEVIKLAPEHPNSIFDHWVLGKLFGYSEEAIEDFVKKL